MEEDLALTLSFVDRMVRDGNYRAAAGAIDDERRRLESTVRSFERARPRPVRRRAAAVGLAAAIVVGTGALATQLPDGGDERRPVPADASIDKTIERLDAALSRAAGDSSALTVLVADVERMVADLPPGAVRDPEVRDGLTRLRDRLLDYAPGAPRNVSGKVHRVASTIGEAVAEDGGAPATPPAPAP